MPDFDLVISADSSTYTAKFRLRDEAGNHLAFHETDFKPFSLSQQQSLFDLRHYVRTYVAKQNEAASVAEVGVFIAEHVLGDEIFRTLWASEAERTLRIELPGASEDGNALAALLARVPWEIARPAMGKSTLGERALLVRVVHDMQAPATEPIALGRDEPLRVLFVFAEARGSSPLAARRERRELLRLFEREVYPKRKVVADFLTHGVTRQRLRSQVREMKGYHVVHWSGHGHLNLLELAKPGGDKDYLSGDELLDLFTKAGGFVPRLFFLSACHSGDILRVKDWKDFIAVAQGQEPGTKPTAEDMKEIALDPQPGYTGTAHALLGRGVSSVVAMRYAVGDEYARDLAVEFYRALLAHAEPATVAEALTMARQALLDTDRRDGARFVACDHATPVLYGEEELGVAVSRGRSSALDVRNPRLHQIAELTAASHEHFVGRTWELAGLGSDFIGSSAGSEVTPVAVVTGLGGMGKTALVAEALALWERRFDWVLLYQAKPNALSLDRDFFWNVHMRLTDKSDAYRARIKTDSRSAIWLPAEGDFVGTRRMEVMLENLLAVMSHHAFLLVLDNFETNLEPNAGATADGEPVWACQDPAWDRCLTALAVGLKDTASRVLITCRRPLAALAGATYRVKLGPLPPKEAALYLREHAGLSAMFFSGNDAERGLAMRLLNASRFHPLLMDRLARLATGGDELRPKLMQALEALETSKNFAQLPELFATKPGDTKELTYLNNALEASIDQLIKDASPDARRLLWAIAVANDPVALGLLKGVWSGESPRRQQLRQIKQVLEVLPLLPPELQGQVKAMPPELRAMIDALPPEGPGRPDPTGLLRALVTVGLVTEEPTGPGDENPDLMCHELVRERIRAWMQDHEQDRGWLTEDAIRMAYADWLAAMFEGLQHENMALALEAGRRAVIYCVEAGDYDRLGEFASRVVTSASDPHMLDGLLPHLEAAAEAAPEGRQRRSCLCYLADALRLGGRPDASLPFYEQAAGQARAEAEAGGEGARRAWSDVGWITGNWALALVIVRDLEAAQERQLESAEANKRAGRPAIDVIMSELEALRIEIMQGKVAEALPEVEARLERVEGCWQQHCLGEDVPEAPDPEGLARAIVSALDIARQAHFAQEDWTSALRRIDAILEVERAVKRPTQDIAATRMNRANVLKELARFGEARAEMEACLQIFQDDPTRREVVLSSLADLFATQGDVRQAIKLERSALAICEQLPDPSDRAISHNNLANYLRRSGMPSDSVEAHGHRFAALTYLLVAGMGQSLQTSLLNYVIDFRRARDEGTTLVSPRLAEVLSDPTFNPLAVWLRQRQVDIDELQTAVDQLLEQARQVALG
jgi:tetratricopeptide (TPR) repeat protein